MKREGRPAETRNNKHALAYAQIPRYGHTVAYSYLYTARMVVARGGLVLRGVISCACRAGTP